MQTEKKSRYEPDIREVAKSLGIKSLDEEPFLLWIVRERIYAPIPPIWTAVRASQDQSDTTLVYLNVITQEVSENHPATEYFRRLVDDERKLFSQTRNHSYPQGSKETVRWEDDEEEAENEGESEEPFSQEHTSSSSDPLDMLEADEHHHSDFLYEGEPSNTKNTTGALAYQMSEEEWSIFIKEEEKRAWELGISKSQLRKKEKQMADSVDDYDLGSQKRASIDRRIFQNMNDKLLYKTGPLQPPPVPAVLEFYSSWLENSASQMLKRNLTIVYSCIENNFMVQLEGSDKIFTLSHLMGKHGVVELWDLHVGASLEVLGRRICLRSAERTTAAWLEKQAKWYTQIAENLEAALHKFGCKKKVTQVSERIFSEKSALEIKRSKGKGSMNLRKLRNEIEEMKQLLSEIRPQLAQKITQNVL